MSVLKESQIMKSITGEGILLDKLKSSNMYRIFPFFEDIEQKSFVRKIIARGTVLFDEGDQCGGVAFVLRGSIRVSKVGKNGREINLYKVSSGDSCILTIASVLSNHSYPARATVEEDTEVILLTVSSLKR